MPEPTVGKPASEKKKSGQGKKLLIGCLGFFVLMIVLSAVLGGKSQQKKPEEKGTVPPKTEKEYRFGERPDKQPDDVELLIGESAELGGMKVAFVNVSRTASLSQFEQADEGKEFVILTVSLENASEKTKRYSYTDFRIQTAGGQVLDAHFSVRDDTLDSADLVTGGKHSGTVVFEVLVEEGHQYILYKPDPFKAERIVVQIQ